MTWLLLFSQAATDPISGGAGWVGAGLLGLVLGWLLLVHLPAKDKQIRELMDQHLKVESEQRKDHAEWERLQRLDFRQILDAMLAHTRQTVDGLSNALKEDLEAVQHALEELARKIK